MAKVGAQRAAELTGKSKSTIQRAMNAGKLSYEVDANSRRLVDVSELDRVFGLQPQGNDTGSSYEAAGASSSGMAVMELELEKARHAIEMERLKMEVRMAQDALDAAQRQIEDLKVQRDLWQKQAQQILITSQYSQKQSEERIAEMRDREEARQRAAEARKMQQGAVNHVPQQQPARTAQPQQARPQQAAPQQPQPQQQRAAVQQPQQAAQQQAAAQQAQAPVFRTVQPGNQNRPVAATPPQKVSLFASLFGTKKTRAV